MDLKKSLNYLLAILACAAIFGLFSRYVYKLLAPKDFKAPAKVIPLKK